MVLAPRRAPVLLPGTTRRGRSVSPPADMRRIGILGGSFDPVHNGHLEIARQARAALALDSLRFVPLRHPPHRPPPAASDTHRQAMLALALSAVFPDPEQALTDPCELRRPGTTHTIDTLRSLRAALPDAALLWLLGEDAFAGLDGWKDWRQLLDYAHLVVVTRRHVACPETSPALRAWTDNVLVAAPARLAARRSGCLCHLDIAPIAASSTEVRRRLAAGQSVSACLPAAVRDYIHAHRLYSG